MSAQSDNAESDAQTIFDLSLKTEKSRTSYYDDSTYEGISSPIPVDPSEMLTDYTDKVSVMPARPTGFQVRIFNEEALNEPLVMHDNMML